MSLHSSEAIPVLDSLPDLPAPYSHSLLADTASRARSAETKIVVVDDDPTGTQTVHGVSAVFSWSHETLAREFSDDRSLFYILANTRSLTPEDAVKVSREIGATIRAVSQSTGRGFSIVSRSDSTLRGHFPGEVDALGGTTGKSGLPVLLIPAFFEGGRITLDGIHYVRDNGRFIPAAQTEFSRDASFGYSNSDLRKWVLEKTGGRYREKQLSLLSLKDIRSGPETVVARLEALEPETVCIVDAVEYRDLEVVGNALGRCRERNSDYMLRSAASIVPCLLGMPPRPLLGTSELSAPSSRSGGMVVVGSYVQKSTRQLNHMLENLDVSPCELSVKNLLGNPQNEIARIIELAARTISAGKDIVLFTERKLYRAQDPDASRRIGHIVSRSLNAVIEGLELQPRFLVVKGGITSHEVASICLKAQKVEVLGQILPGIPVWKMGPESTCPGLPYVVFPGNVGEDDAMTRIVEKLT